jgi:hypothetical protein
MPTTKKKRNPLIVVLKVIIVIICVIAILLAGIRAGFTVAYFSFYNNGQREFTIPGLSDGFVPQGLEYVKESDVFITCGYASKEGDASSVYTIKSDGSATKTALKNTDGSNYTGHTGGIAYYKNYVYITGATGCDVFSLTDILNGKETTTLLGEIATPNDPAYCNIYEGKFYAGSFYKAGTQYTTPESHHLTTPAGDSNTAIMTVYNLDATAEFLVNTQPVAAYSLPSLAQGMTFTEDKIVLSTSYGLATSHLYFYDTSKITTGTFTFADTNSALDGTTVPLYYLDSASLVSDVAAPPMSEEIVYKDGKIYIMTEAASNKYIFGKFTGAYKLYSYNVK